MLRGQSLCREGREQPSATISCNTAPEPEGVTTPPANPLGKEVVGQSQNALGQPGLKLEPLQREGYGEPRAVPVPAPQTCQGSLLLSV